MLHTDTAQLTHLIEQPLTQSLNTPLLYHVQAGDSLSQIIAKHYGIYHTEARYQTALAALMHFNPDIVDPNRIRAGQLIKLMPLNEDRALSHCAVPEDFYHTRTTPTRHRLEPVDQYYLQRLQQYLPTQAEEQAAFWSLAWLQENYDILSISAGIGFNSFGGLVSQAHNAFIAEVKTLYTHYQQGALTKGQYDYRRQAALKHYANKLGPFEKFLFQGQTAQEAARINRSKALPATATIDLHLDRLNRLSRYAKNGGVLLTAAGVGMGCYHIAQTASQQTKNEIFVETFGSTVAGAGTGIALTLFFATTPAGWITALALGTAAAVGSWGAGKGLQALYSRSEQKIDFVSGLGIDELCN
ncbi:MAG: LysM domain-containing protein [Cellvibrionaceae bacterium]|nr:LysM domain-containing protein [Cellvibrionaceae bacterium]